MSPLDRSQVHQSATSLSTLHALLTSHAAALAGLAQLRRKIAKHLGGIADARYVVVDALKASAKVWDSLGEADARCAKTWERECDSLGSELNRWFKKIAKEEKTHDEQVAALNTKLSRAAGQSYDPSNKRNLRAPSPSYSANLSALTANLHTTTSTHLASQTSQHTSALLLTAGTTARLAEADWSCVLDSVKSVCGSVGELGVARSACEGAWNVEGGIAALLGTTSEEASERPDVDGGRSPTDDSREPNQPRSRAASPTTQGYTPPRSPGAGLRPPRPTLSPRPSSERALSASPQPSQRDERAFSNGLLSPPTGEQESRDTRAERTSDEISLRRRSAPTSPATPPSQTPSLVHSSASGSSMPSSPSPLSPTSPSTRMVDGGRQRLARTDTVDSMASERSYVARMREKYMSAEVEEALSAPKSPPPQARGPPARSMTSPPPPTTPPTNSPFHARADTRALGGIGRFANPTTSTPRSLPNRATTGGERNPYSELGERALLRAQKEVHALENGYNPWTETPRSPTRSPSPAALGLAPTHTAGYLVEKRGWGRRMSVPPGVEG